MSRSRRKTPITGNSKADSEKADKKICHRVFRAKERQALSQGKEPPYHMAEASDDWMMAKDGRQLFDPDKHPELMRK